MPVALFAEEEKNRFPHRNISFYAIHFSLDLHLGGQVYLHYYQRSREKEMKLNVHDFSKPFLIDSTIRIVSNIDSEVRDK